jgi:hypothetical protein
MPILCNKLPKKRATSSESRIQQDIRLALGLLDGCVFWRNNVGLAVHEGGDVMRYGLAPGSSDLIGIVDGRFCALEVKSVRGRVTEDQRTFLELVRKVGGFAAVVRSVEEAAQAIERCRKGASE